MLVGEFGPTALSAGTSNVMKGGSMAAETTASKTAKFLLKLAGERGLEISNLKLQKLLYYSQGWHLGILEKPLFGERIEAWIRGPVVPPVYGEFKCFRWEPIPLESYSESTIEPGDPRWPIETHLSEVLDTYGKLNGRELELRTHREKPWLDARVGLVADSPSTALISCDSMMAFFKPQVRKA
ncbi:MAG: type II toxin-antitoxin system antitoxin SocA domain-containing protein [Acidobacteriota bacterium]